MKILVINAGSSSLKYSLFDMETGEVPAKGGCEKIGVEGSLGIITHKRPDKEKHVVTQMLPTHNTALEVVLALLTDPELGVISGIEEIGAVGYRIVHGGETLTVNVVDDKVLKTLESLIPINPLHAPPAIAAINACRAQLPDVTHVIVCDNAFHATIPEEAYMFALPYEYYEEDHVRRYGFHGTSHRYVSEKAAEAFGSKEIKVVTCHLGNGSSFSAIKNGVCVDTTMGFTPLDGIMMGTRCGAVDPTAITYLMKKHNLTPDEMDTVMNKKSGFLGLSGVSSDCREVMEADAAGNARAHLAMQVFYHQAKKIIGSLVAELNGADALVFTAGIGENDAVARANICRNLDAIGIQIDEEANSAMKRGTFGDITAKGSRTKVYVIPTDEEFMIAKETYDIVTK